jgi:hypothetical protein
MLLRRHFIAASTLAALGPRAVLASATVGQPAPEFTLKDVTGKAVRLGDFKGRHVVLEWTNPGCPFVRKHYEGGNMQATQAGAVSRGVVWLAVNSTHRGHYDHLEPASLAAWMKERRSAPSAMLLDEDGLVGRAYGARTTPHMFIVDPLGRLIYAGGIDSIASARSSDIAKAINYVNQGLGEALAGRTLTVANAPTYGCSVKYKS